MNWNLLYPLFEIGIVPASGEVDIFVSFSPTSFSSALMKMQLDISQFLARPLICMVTGRCLPGMKRYHIISFCWYRILSFCGYHLIKFCWYHLISLCGYHIILVCWYHIILFCWCHITWFCWYHIISFCLGRPQVLTDGILHYAICQAWAAIPGGSREQDPHF